MIHVIALSKLIVPRMITLALRLALVLSTLTATASAQEIKLQPGLIAGKQVYLIKLSDSAYCEIAVVFDTPPHALAQLYNTTGTTGPEGGCPASAFAAIDGGKLATALHAANVYLNPTPPVARRYWVMDELQVYRVGETVDFMGVEATWVGAVPAEQVRNAVSAPYAVVEAHLEWRFAYRKGSMAFFLHSPDHKTWVMQSYTTEVDAELNFEQLSELGGKLNLPPGWIFEAHHLSEGMAVDPRNAYGTAHLVRDDLHNVYIGCGFDTTCGPTLQSD